MRRIPQGCARFAVGPVAIQERRNRPGGACGEIAGILIELTGFPAKRASGNPSVARGRVQAVAGRSDALRYCILTVFEPGAGIGARRCPVTGRGSTSMPQQSRHSVESSLEFA